MAPFLVCKITVGFVLQPKHIVNEAVLLVDDFLSYLSTHFFTTFSTFDRSLFPKNCKWPVTAIFILLIPGDCTQFHRDSWVCLSLKKLNTIVMVYDHGMWTQMNFYLMGSQQTASRSTHPSTLDNTYLNLKREGWQAFKILLLFLENRTTHDGEKHHDIH